MTRTLIYGIIALIIVIIAAVIAFLFGSEGNTLNDSGNGAPGFFESLFPFGTGSIEQPLFEGEGGDDITTEPGRAPVLRQVSQEPVSGGFMFEQGGQTYIRFINRATGHIYETVATSTIVTRITNTTVPGIQETLWLDAHNVIVRYLNGDSIETFFARLSPTAEGEQRLNGVFLESYKKGVLDPQKETLLAQFSNARGSTFTLSNPDGTNSREVFTSPLTSWVPLQSANNIFVYSAPLSGFDGFLYQVSGGSLVKVAGNIPGLMAQISPSGDYALISSGDESLIELIAVNTETGEEVVSPVSTITSKCVFNIDDETRAYCGIPNSIPTALYPNDWLLGNVSFSDSVWDISLTDGVATLLTNFQSDTNQLIDVWQPTLSPSGSHLLFINRNDLSLWSLELETGAVTEEN